MKKALFPLVAVVLAASLNLAVFADKVPANFYSARLANNSDASDTSNGAVTAPQASSITSADEGIVVGPKEMFLVDESMRVVGEDYDILAPDTEYTFRIYYNKSDKELTTAAADPARLADSAAIIAAGEELTGLTLNGGDIRLRTVTGSASIESARIKTTGRGDTEKYDLVLKTRDAFGTKIAEVEYALSVTGSKAPAGTFQESSHFFEVGHQTISDSETDVGEEGYIVISNDRPVITKEQFADIAKSANYKAVTLEAEDEGWSFTGRVSGTPDSNFYYTYDVLPELVNRFPDQEYKFVNFQSGVSFPGSGEMRIDVSDIRNDASTLYAYLYRNGKLTRINSTYDTSTDELVFRTNYLGTFFITDKKITDTSIIIDDVQEDPDEGQEPEADKEGPGSGNPSTGATNGLTIAVTLALASLVAAGAVSRRRK